MKPPLDYVHRDERIPQHEYNHRTAEMLAWVFGCAAGLVTGVVGTLLYLNL